MATCRSCGSSSPDGARFCPTCGAAAAVPTCSACGHELSPPDARFCMSCGQPVEGLAPGARPTTPAGPIASRRVTSVLFADLVGFTPLTETRDQEDVRDLLSRYFEESRALIVRYGGTVEKFIGDAVMAVWGVPIAHEDDAERAVRAGLELAMAVNALGEEVGAPGLSLRVGIVTGEVAVTVGAEHQGMVAGDTVNTAARVQSVAVPGQVWVDETTRLLTAEAITYADVGSHQLKGKADAVPLWAARAVVAAVGGAQRADGLEAPLVGRARELRLVKELFHRTAEAGDPALLVIDGDAGLGKTRLAWEFEKYVDGLSSTVRWHHGRCIAYGEGVAFYALAEAVRGRLRVLDDDLTDTVERATEDDLDALLGRWLDRHARDSEERAWLEPRLGGLVGLGSAATFAREDLFAAWVTFFERVGDGEPVVLVVDDAHHADDGLLLFLDQLLRTAGFACFVVLLTRPGLVEAHPDLATNRRATLVHLRTLADADVGELVDGLVSDVPPAVRDRLVRRAEGVPLFAVETVRSLIDRDLVLPRGGRYELSDPDALDLDALGAPASLQALVAARLDTLSSDQRLLVDRASVLGTSFAREAITALCPELEAPDGVLNELEHLQILSRDSNRLSAGFGRFEFVQSVVRQVAYATLSRHDRKAWHLAVVRMFEAGEDQADDTAAIRAQHYLDAVAALPTAADVGDLREAALGHLRRAATRASALGSPGEAARHLLTAIDLSEDPRLRWRLGRELAGFECDAGRYEDSITHATAASAAAAEAGDRVEAGHAAAVHALALANGLGDNESAMSVAEPWWQELQGNAEASAALLALAGAVTTARSRQGMDFSDVLESRMLIASRQEEFADLADCYVALGVHYADIGLRDLASLLLEAGADLGRAHHQPAPLVRALINLTAGTLPTDLAKADLVGREAVELSTLMGLGFWAELARCNRVASLWWRGEWEAMERILAEPAKGGEELPRQFLAQFSIQVALARGTAIEAAPSAATKVVDDVMGRYWDLFHEAVLRQAAGDPATGARSGLAAVELCTSLSGLWDDLTHLWPAVARMALEADDHEVLDRLLAILEPPTGPLAPLGLRAHGLQVRGLRAFAAAGDLDDVEEAESLLHQAITDLERWGAPVAAARARADLGLALARRGRTEEAETQLAQARTVFERLGADAWLAEIAPTRVVGLGHALG